MEKCPAEQAVEYCVLCGKATGVLQTCPVDRRENYIIGGGQLCRSCWNELFRYPNASEISSSGS